MIAKGEYDQELPQSQTDDRLTAPLVKDTEHRQLQHNSSKAKHNLPFIKRTPSVLYKTRTRHKTPQTTRTTIKNERAKKP